MFFQVLLVKNQKLREILLIQFVSEIFPLDVLMPCYVYINLLYGSNEEGAIIKQRAVIPYDASLIHDKNLQGIDIWEVYDSMLWLEFNQTKHEANWINLNWSN